MARRVCGLIRLCSKEYLTKNTTPRNSANPPNQANNFTPRKVSQLMAGTIARPGSSRPGAPVDPSSGIVSAVPVGCANTGDGAASPGTSINGGGAGDSAAACDSAAAKDLSGGGASIGSTGNGGGAVVAA